MLRIIQSLRHLVTTLWLYLFTPLVFAAQNNDPFPHITLNNGNVVNAVGAQMESGMKYSLIGGGIIMLLVSIGVIMHRLREDSINKDTGNFLTTLVAAGLAITVGIILIAIGWSAASYHPAGH